MRVAPPVARVEYLSGRGRRGRDCSTRPAVGVRAVRPFMKIWRMAFRTVRAYSWSSQPVAIRSVGLVETVVVGGSSPLNSGHETRPCPDATSAPESQLTRRPSAHTSPAESPPRPHEHLHDPPGSDISRGCAHALLRRRIIGIVAALDIQTAQELHDVGSCHGVYDIEPMRRAPGNHARG